MKDNRVALELRHITKRFGDVVANRDISLEVRRGEILSLLGENGSGKTTLMNMISGIYYPDEGHILIDGKNAVISSPHDAFAYKIGMIHQHIKLVDVFTAAENVVLGVKQIGGLNPQETLAQAEVACRREGLEMIPGEQAEVLPADGKHTVGVIKARSGDETVRLIFGLHGRRGYSKRDAVESVKAICTRYGFDLDPNKKIYNMSVSEKQTVEIVKVLYRGADIDRRADPAGNRKAVCGSAPDARRRQGDYHHHAQAA